MNENPPETSHEPQPIAPVGVVNCHGALFARLRRLFARNEFIPFDMFNSRYAGRACYIVGRGPTTFDYTQLGSVDDPVLFINDAVSLERHVRGESFFFAHDAPLEIWLTRGLKSTAVLPVGGKLWKKLDEAKFNHGGAISFYAWNTGCQIHPLNLTRDELARVQELSRHCGTIHSLLHFVWYCGFTRVNFIGCDGINDVWQLNALAAPTGYDSRIENLSATAPWFQYSEIRQVQDELCKRFGFQVKYLGTPTLSRPPRPLLTEKRIPPVAHFTWLGGPIPKIVQRNIAEFRALHPSWDVKLWAGVPPGMPDDLRVALYRTSELCMRADIIRLWLLHEYGGVYLDGDVIALRSFEELRGYDHFAGYRRHGTINNAVLGAAPRSGAMQLLMEELRSSLNTPAAQQQRTMYGPDLLRRIHARQPGALNILPAHYFYIFNTHKTGAHFARATSSERRDLIEKVRDRISDGVEPYAIHMWGIPREEMPTCYGAQSSWVKTLASGDALLRRVGTHKQAGAEVGGNDGQLAAYWLGHNSQLVLTCVPENGGANSVRELTSFAADRATVLNDANGCVGPDSLDWIFLHDARHADEWLPKLRRDAVLAVKGAEPVEIPGAQSVGCESGVMFFRRI